MQTPFYFSPKPVIRTFWDFYPANLHVHLFLQRFHMDIDVGTVAEGLAQLVFDIRGATVRFVKRYPAWHTQMHLYGDIAAYTTGAEMMYAAHLRLTLGNLYNPLLHISRQTLLEQFAGGGINQPQRRTHDEDTHHNGGNRVKHCPASSRANLWSSRAWWLSLLSLQPNRRVFRQ